ncbi:MAG TPA: hypothetical protein VNK95_13795, partial [Caldilineaceae bacterium]|nr:hypothetical protein [Caldilineaceae bacterium]
PRFGSPAVASHDEPELRTRLPVESPVLGQRAARRGMALIQRALDPRVSAKPGLAHPQRAVISRPQAAATVHPPQEPMAQPLPSPEPSATRGQREVSAHVPLASRGGSPGDVIRRTPQHPPRRAEPGDGAGQGSGASRQAARQATMPLAKLRTGTGAETVQRQTEGGQRPDAPPVEAAQTARPAPPAVAGQPPTGKVARGGGVEEMLNTDDREDLDEVARAILPLVKRLLTTERERRLFR